MQNAPFSFPMGFASLNPFYGFSLRPTAKVPSGHSLREGTRRF